MPTLEESAIQWNSNEFNVRCSVLLQEFSPLSAQCSAVVIIGANYLQCTAAPILFSVCHDVGVGVCVCGVGPSVCEQIGFLIE